MNNFLQDYKLYASGNEAPEDFHVWAGFYALSCFCGRRFWTDQGFFTVFPNLYLVFVGRPGIKKTTAMDISEALVREVSRLAGAPQLGIPIAPTGATKESLLETMASKDSPCKKVFKHEDKPVSYTQIAIFASEIANLLQTGGDPVAYITTLTDISDPRNSFDTKTISRGLQSIPGPYVTLFGCMTPETTGNLIKENALSGGFSRRCIFVYADRNSKPVPIPIVTDEQKAAWERTVKRGKELLTMQGKFEWSDLGKAEYISWYTRNFDEQQNASTVAIQNFLMSKPTMVIKIAMLLKLAYSNELILDTQEICTAIDLLDAVQPHVSNVFSGIGRNVHAATMAGIQSVIESKCAQPPHYITEKRLKGMFLQHASMRELDQIIRDMVHAEQIKMMSVKPTAGGAFNVLCSPSYYETVRKIVGGSEPPGRPAA